jgi:hypothetical protein
MQPFECTLLRQLVADPSFAERVLPYLKDRHFLSEEAGMIFHLYAAFFVKYRKVPSFAALRIGLDNLAGRGEQEIQQAQQALVSVQAEPALDASQAQWMLETTEAWVKERAIYIALQDAIKIMDDPKQSPGAIPTLMKDALAVSFDTHVGHDYFADAEDRYAFYHTPEVKLPFDLTTLNDLTNQGVPRKSLNVVLAGTNVGKSLALCHFAASYVASNKNVLYITCEMAEQWIAQRIDANLFNIPMDDVVRLSKMDYSRKVAHARSSSTGRLLIKEYPTSTAHAGHFRTLLQELLLKQQFVPDVVLVDYLTICGSEKIKMSGSINGFTFYKLVSEELRALAMEANVPIWTAAQFNRQGFQSTDPGLEHVGESFGIAQVADFCFALVSTDELEQLGQIALLELKNRYNKRRSYQQHILGLDTPRMKLYELNASQKAATLTLPSAVPSAPTSGAPAFASRGRRSAPMASLIAENENNPGLHAE